MTDLWPLYKKTALYVPGAIRLPVFSFAKVLISSAGFDGHRITQVLNLKGNVRVDRPPRTIGHDSPMLDAAKNAAKWQYPRALVRPYTKANLVPLYGRFMRFGTDGQFWVGFLPGS